MCSYNVAFEWGDGSEDVAACEPAVEVKDTPSLDCDAIKKVRSTRARCVACTNIYYCARKHPHTYALRVRITNHTLAITETHCTHRVTSAHDLQVMSSFSLPSSAVPAWAAALPESVWVAAVKEAAVTGSDIRSIIKSMSYGP